MRDFTRVNENFLHLNTFKIPPNKIHANTKQTNIPFTKPACKKLTKKKKKK